MNPQMLHWFQYYKSNYIFLQRLQLTWHIYIMALGVVVN